MHAGVQGAALLWWYSVRNPKSLSIDMEKVALQQWVAFVALAGLGQVGHLTRCAALLHQSSQFAARYCNTCHAWTSRTEMLGFWQFLWGRFGGPCPKFLLNIIKAATSHCQRVSFIFCCISHHCIVALGAACDVMACLLWSNLILTAALGIVN